MAVTKPPWGELPPEAAMFQIGIGQSVPLLPDNLSVQLKDIFRQCISRFGRERTIGRGEEKRDGMGWEKEREK